MPQNQLRDGPVHRIGSLELQALPDGVGVVVFDRPPVNAVSLSVYQDIGAMADHIAASPVRCVVWTAAPGARAWCGGADLNDFVGMDPERRHERYEVINAQLRRFYDLDRPIAWPVMAATIGILVGGGLQLTLAQDRLCHRVLAMFFD